MGLKFQTEDYFRAEKPDSGSCRKRQELAYGRDGRVSDQSMMSFLL